MVLEILNIAYTPWILGTDLEIIHPKLAHLLNLTD